jgi:hypothetical protein
VAGTQTRESGARSGEFGTADAEAIADKAMAMLDGTGVRMLIHDPAMELDRARALVLFPRAGGGVRLARISARAVIV